MKALLISSDPELRAMLRVAMGNSERRTGERWEYLEANDGLEGIAVARREAPDLVVAEEIASRAGGFAVAKDLRGAHEPFPGAIVLILARPQDDWLAKWSGADAWFTRPVDPFALADAVIERLGLRDAVRPTG